MYEDFEDLRDNCPVAIRADVAIDLEADDAAVLAAVWPVTGDGEFRLSLVQAVSDFWEGLVRGRGDVAEDCFAIEIVVDSYNDPDMGSTLYLDLHAYCGTEAVGELAWAVFEDDDLERAFTSAMAETLPQVLDRFRPDHGVRFNAEVDEIEEL